ncbi:hypothetical protein ACQJBY_048796 [Aegilops geniculata]
MFPQRLTVASPRPSPTSSSPIDLVPRRPLPSNVDLETAADAPVIDYVDDDPSLPEQPGAFFDLPRSASDAAAFYRAEQGSSTESVFWSQYSESGHPVPLSDQLKQLAELHKAAEQAMKGLLVRLWPGEALPGSYFGLVRRLVEACPRLEVIKHSVCIEGARRALARVRVHWGKLDGEKLVKDGPPQGKEHRKPENYYKDVLAGALLVADECTKDVVFE